MSSFHTTADLYDNYRDVGEAVVADPGSGGTFDLRGRWGGISTIASGTRKLPNSAPIGVKFYVKATGNVTLTTVAGTAVATLTAGQMAECCPQTSSTWACVVYATGPLTPAQLLTQFTTTQGFIPIPLTQWREVTSNDITNAAGNGGVLATDSTPTLEYVNGDTDSQIRMLWATSNVDAIATQITLPPELDRTADIKFWVRGILGSAADDAMTIDLDTFFDEGDTKVEDSGAGFSDLDTGNVSVTVAAADVPDTATTMSIELTPGTHANGTFAAYATWLTYQKKLLTS